MLWVGITGDIGAGKSTVVDLLRQKSYQVLNADQLVHSLYEQDNGLKNSIKDIFGERSLSKGIVDRVYLSERIKENKELLHALEKLVHPIVKSEVISWKKKHKDLEIAFYEVPLLFEKKMEKDFDYIIFVSADEDIMSERLKKRNSWSKKEIKDRRSWLDCSEEKKKKSDFVIENNSTMENLKFELEKVLNQITKIERSPSSVE